jgi:hypothetical protein
VGDTALASLNRCKNLRTLHLAFTHVTLAAVKALRRALPEVNVVC